MALRLNTTVRNARLDAIEAAIGTDAILQIRSGSPPASIDDAAAGDLLATLALPSDWMAEASGGSKGKAGTWEDPTADASGTAGHFRILDATGTTCMMDGTVTDTTGAGPLKLSTTVIVEGYPVTIATFTLVDGNAG